MTDDIKAKMEALKQNYVQNARRKVADIESAWLDLQKSWQPEPMANLHRAAHSMSGSAATYGFDQLGAAAKRLENQLEPLTKRAATAEEIGIIDGLIAELKTLAP